MTKLTLPSARRVARASIHIATERGMDELTACQAVSAAARLAQRVLRGYGVQDVSWVADIEREAIRLASSHRPAFPRAGEDAPQP